MLFSDKHIWLVHDNETARLGISDYAQIQLGGIMFLNLPDIGDNIIIGERFGDIESLKTISDLIAPISGVVTAINESLIDELDMINAKPYNSWFVEISVSEVSDKLMNENEYKEFVTIL